MTQRSRMSIMNFIRKMWPKRFNSGQADIWAKHMDRIELSDVLSAFQFPAQFQRELAELIDSRASEGRRIVEVGCETAVTSLLLSEANEKTAIDINRRAISLVEGAAAQLNKKLRVLVCDMFAMPFRNAEFDIVFNAGVIEHCSAEERTLALSEYARIMKDDGLMIIAFPNHHCPPYRFAYLVMRLLGVWRFPSEYSIYDLKSEAQRCGLHVSERLTLSRGTIFNWLNFLPPVKALFWLLDKFFPYEGYLTVIILSKSRA
jgi:ubiquinone/menaquinone biosynthesis C-methylase UbiE